MPLQNVFWGLFFVSHEPDVGWLHPVPLGQLVQPQFWEAAPLCEASQCPDQPQTPAPGALSSPGQSVDAPSWLVFSGLLKGVLRSYGQHLSCTLLWQGVWTR